MKIKEYRAKINNLSFSELADELQARRVEYRNIRFEIAVGKYKNTHQKHRIKKQIAQILTTAGIKQIKLLKEKTGTNNVTT